MALVAAPESLTDCMDEWCGLHRAHYEELALDKDRVPLDPDLDRYRVMDAAGLICFVSLREAGRLVGYFVGFVMPHLHYRTCLTATMDIFWVSPEVRGRFGGVRLFRAAEAELRSLGVQRWFVGEKLHKPAGRLFGSLGFTPVETYHSKWIGP